MFAAFQFIRFVPELSVHSSFPSAHLFPAFELLLPSFLTVLLLPPSNSFVASARLRPRVPFAAPHSCNPRAAPFSLSELPINPTVNFHSIHSSSFHSLISDYFRSGDEELELIPMDEFLAHAADKGIELTDEIKADEHRLRLARLEFELKQREEFVHSFCSVSSVCRMAEELQQSDTKKNLLGSDIKAKENRLAQIRAQIGLIRQTGKPLGEMLGSFSFSCFLLINRFIDCRHQEERAGARNQRTSAPIRRRSRALIPSGRCSLLSSSLYPNKPHESKNE